MARCKLHNTKYKQGYTIKVSLNETGHPVTVVGKLHKDNYVWASNYCIQSGFKTQRYQGQSSVHEDKCPRQGYLAIQVKHSREHSK